MKLTNGDYVRNMNNEQFAKWVCEMAEEINLGQIGEKSLECWLNQTPEVVIPVSSNIWDDWLRERFNRRE